MGYDLLGGGCGRVGRIQLGRRSVAVPSGCIGRNEGKDVHHEKLTNQWICNAPLGMMRSL